MHVRSIRFRSVLVLAAGLAAALVFFIPVTGLAQSTPQPKPIKQAIIEQEAREVAAAQAAPKPSKHLAKPARVLRQPLSQAERAARSAESPLPHRQAGSGTIVESGQAPFPASTYTFENRWFTKSGSSDLVVYAGAAHDNPSQGLLVVRSIGPATVYRTPSRAGAVRIVAADGERLSLVASSGSRLTFDVSSRTFSQ